MLREARGVLKETVDNRTQPDYQFVQFFVGFFPPKSHVLWQAMLKSKSAHIENCRPKPD